MKQFKIQQQITLRNERSIEKYFTEVSKEGVVTPKEEIELARKIKKGDAVAKEKLIKANLRFVISVAKNYQNNGLDLSDLINEGNIGLIRAAEDFDETKGFKFISYAVWWIRQSIIQSIADNKRVVKIPSNKNLQIGKFNRAISELTQVLGRYPTDLEISEYMEITEDNAKELGAINKEAASLNKKVGEDNDSATLEDFMENDIFDTPEDTLIHDSLLYDINRAFSFLSEKESSILRGIYGIGCEQKSKEILADEYSYTPERIRQISNEATRKIKRNKKASKLLIKYL